MYNIIIWAKSLQKVEEAVATKGQEPVVSEEEEERPEDIEGARTGRNTEREVKSNE